eukprot:TRINITY_DN29761_c0_g1_i1.p1 TRINITY_DN29761_c0_g1~~TRINITY_DN29761_c0_g1_i1.p1  ORF type:complete len:839 (-),score=241.25 TRINITY_DN29761_c0_g1_i1:71-2587(-)
MSVGPIIDNTAKAVFLELRGCENNCGISVLGKDYAEHLRKFCAYRLEICPIGCGEQLYGKDVERHGKSECPMGRCLDEAEERLKDQQMQDPGALNMVRKAVLQAYVERDKACARISARGEMPPAKGWPTHSCGARVASAESQMREVQARLRRRAKERLQLVLAKGDEVEEEGAKTEKVSAAKMLDMIASSADKANRAARPWDIEGKAIPNLVSCLVQAAECFADEQLRRQTELLLINSVRRLLEAASVMEEEATLDMAKGKAMQALQVIELEDASEVQRVLDKIEAGRHLLTLKKISTADIPEDFFLAARNGDVDMVALYLQHERANPCVVDPQSGLPLVVLAAKAGDIPMCRLLSENKANLNARCSVDGFSALHWAAQWRNARVLDVLLQAGASPRTRDWKGQDPLMKLVRRSMAKPAKSCEWKWEIEHGPEPLPGPRLDDTGFMRLEEARTLAETLSGCVGFSLYTADVMGESLCPVSLHGPGARPPRAAAPSAVSEQDAAENTRSPSPDGEAKRARSPKAKGKSKAKAKAKAAGDGGNEGAAQAAEAGDGGAKKRPARSPSPKKSSRPESAASKKGSRPPTAKQEEPAEEASATVNVLAAALQKPAAPKAKAKAEASKGGEEGEEEEEPPKPVKPRKDVHDYKPYEARDTKKGWKPAARKFKKEEAPVEEEPQDDSMLWTSYLKVPMDPTHDVRSLLASGADCTAEDEGGLTALHHHLLSAPGGGSLAVVDLLVRHSADVNKRDRTDRQSTPLLLAVTARRADMVRLMINEAWPPADVDVATPDGFSALSIAESSGAKEIAKMLREAGATEWKGIEMRLGKNTLVTFDSRVPVRT